MQPLLQDVAAHLSVPPHVAGASFPCMRGQSINSITASLAVSVSSAGSLRCTYINMRSSCRLLPRLLAAAAPGAALIARQAEIAGLPRLALSEVSFTSLRAISSTPTAFQSALIESLG